MLSIVRDVVDLADAVVLFGLVRGAVPAIAERTMLDRQCFARCGFTIAHTFADVAHNDCDVRHGGFPYS